ncbi:MAG: MATE family efflux transporter [Ruminococcaceae bacterium]|nr:MATE family efflux transporter [Oscillospiraceae bacterium]
MENIKTERKNFWKLLLTLALPIALQHLLINSLTFVDTLFMSQLGDVALSASGMAFQWNWLLSMITFGLCSGSALFIAQYWGAGQKDNIRKTCKIATVTALGAAVLFMFGALCFPSQIMKIFNRNPDVVKTGVDYLRILAFSYPATALTSVLSTVLRSTERVKLPMFVSGISTFANIILDYAMIFGKLGFPKMGVEGAALATTISAWIGLVLLVGISVYQKNILIMPIKEYLRFSFDDYKAFMVKASPVIINELLWGLGTVCNNVIYSNTGYENFAACTILRTVESLCLILFIGLNDGGAVIVGKTIGEGNYDKAYRSAKRLVYSTPIISAVLAVFVIIFREKVVYLFNMSGNITQKTVNVAMAIIVIYAVELCFRNIPYTMICAIFRSGGDSFTGAKFDIICLWFLAIPITLFTAFGLKLAFPMVMLVEYLVEDIPKCIMCLKHFKSRKWIKPVAEFDDAALK